MYVLDTTTISDYLRGNQKIIDHFRQVSFETIYTTSISKFELQYGLIKKPQLQKPYADQLNLLGRKIGFLDFDRDAAGIAAAIKHQLFKRGTPISLEDIMIAAIALSHEYVVVTSNTKHFELIAGLAIEDWSC